MARWAALPAVLAAVAASPASASLHGARPPSDPIVYGGRLICPFPRDPGRCEGKRAYRAAIYLLLRPGAAPRRLTGQRFDDSQPAWSPDRRRIAFVRGAASGGTLRIWVMRADGSSARAITSGPLDTEPQWSPDGRWIAYRSGRDVFVIHSDGRGRRNVTTNTPGITAVAPTWARNGDRIAFRRQATPGGTGIYSIGVAGGRLRRLARDGYEPDWSTDGTRIAYIRRDRTTGPGWQLHTMGVNGGTKRRVTSGSSWTSPAWASDSRWLAAVRREQVTIVRADGTGARALTPRRRGFVIDGISW